MTASKSVSEVPGLLTAPQQNRRWKTMKVRTIEEARLVKELVDQLSHEEQLVVFRYPEHATSSVGIANLSMLEAMQISEVKYLVKATKYFMDEFNARLAKGNFKERVDLQRIGEETFDYAAVWFYTEADVTEVFVDYGSPLHHMWGGYIQD